MNLGAIVFDDGEDPDRLLRDFAADLSRDGRRVAGLAHAESHKAGATKLGVRLLHSGEELQLFQDLGREARGCRLDVSQLLDAGAHVAQALDKGADLLIINRFGRQEEAGQGLLYLIERGVSAGIPVLVPVARERLAAWEAFSGDLGTTLVCERRALDQWWIAVS